MEHCERKPEKWLIGLSDGSTLVANLNPRDRSELNAAMDGGASFAYQDEDGSLVIVFMRHVMWLKWVE